MPVTNVDTDTDNLTLTITAEFAAPVDRVWQVYADPRQLEQIWGPPTYPVTVVDHSFQPGGKVTYFMTSPEGEKHHAYMDITEVNEPRSFAFNDAFTDAEFNAIPGMPTALNTHVFEATDGGTRATYTSVYESTEALQQVLDMGVLEGASSAINQIDDFLAA